MVRMVSRWSNKEEEVLTMAVVMVRMVTQKGRTSTHATACSAALIWKAADFNYFETGLRGTHIS